MEEIENNSKLNKDLEDALKLESKNFNVVKKDGLVCSYVIQLETVISGHDGWIYGVHWKANYSGKFCKSSSVAIVILTTSFYVHYKNVQSTNY